MRETTVKRTSFFLEFFILHVVYDISDVTMPCTGAPPYNIPSLILVAFFALFQFFRETFFEFISILLARWILRTGITYSFF